MPDTDQHPPVQPHLCVKGGSAALAFYQKAFGAQISMKVPAQDGVRLMHATVRLFGGEVLIHDEFPEHHGDGKVLSPKTAGGPSVAINVNLGSAADVDAAMEKAEAAGAVIVMPAENTFWNARYGRILDPFGHVWAFNAPLADA
ncbi:VOC family protein [Hansschlegelia zhihuaiae]|uniref:VOC family protein n=1 Tax=Hansschlegelia zhihuaiae TaxID=405005 RepID=A0A4Q0MJD2_9HYPH|nr:VOC family protein [Hansschlegelia zhihuaiae]RXF73066.1 VOC family protein [Hansschlegelia zhihuaiae]